MLKSREETAAHIASPARGHPRVPPQFSGRFDWQWCGERVPLCVTIVVGFALTAALMEWRALLCPTTKEVSAPQPTEPESPGRKRWIFKQHSLKGVKFHLSFPSKSQQLSNFLMN